MQCFTIADAETTYPVIILRLAFAIGPRVTITQTRKITLVWSDPVEIISIENKFALNLLNFCTNSVQMAVTDSLTDLQAGTPSLG